MKNLELHIRDIIDNKLKHNYSDIPLDYFSWGRDSRHIMDYSMQSLKRHFQRNFFKKAIRTLVSLVKGFTNQRQEIFARFKKDYANFDESYQLMSDQYSKNLFAELILLKLSSENVMHLSSFTQEFIDSYEVASKLILRSNDTFPMYKWLLRKITLDNPSITFYTGPNFLTLHYTGRLYRYHRDNAIVEVEGGDIIIDAGVGWGDTSIYLAALADNQSDGFSYAFDILEEGLNALSKQCNLNPGLKNIKPILRALSDKDDEQVYITSASPGSKVVKEKTGRKVETITIDTFSKENNLKKVDFIKMDIEGAEVPALIGASNTIKSFKPKLAISVYHKWDDLLVIPKLIHSIRNDYSYYLDCTTGHGGETILYCR